MRSAKTTLTERKQHGIAADEADVFLSYSRTDESAVRHIQASLKQAGLATFLDRDQLPAGQPWLSALEQAIAHCAAVAVLVGPAGFGTWQQREVQLALDRQADAERAGCTFPVIPILLPKVEDPPGGFLRLQTWVDLRSDLADPTQLDLLLAGLRGQAPADASTLREALCPYRGLLSFREEDAGLFFGREEAIDTLLGKMRDHNLVTLVGRSGSGKSSVVFAGLVPALRRRADGRTWSILSLRPGSEPLHALTRLFAPPPIDLSPFEADQYMERQVMILRTDNHALGRRIRSLLASAEETGTNRLLLHVDQWEELYSQALRNPAVEPELAERDVTQFIDLLFESTRTSPCTVVLTVRADFYGEFLKHGPLAAAVPPGQVNLGPLSREGLTAAIRKPAEAVGLAVDPPLLETLVDEVCNDIGKLPLLEYALKETWRRREGQRLTLNAYGQAGGIDGAVAQRANQIFTSLSQAQQAAARRLFVSLVTPGEDREDTRARAVYPEQDDAIAAVIAKYSAADARLLVTGEDAPSARRLVELSHEAMIREWDLLKTWIEANREALRRREHIRARMRQWEEQGNDPTLLLSSGLPLEESRKLLADHGDVLIGEVQPYIAASLAVDEERRRQAEAAAEAERQSELTAALAAERIKALEQQLSERRRALEQQLSEGRREFHEEQQEIQRAGITESGEQVSHKLPQKPFNAFLAYSHAADYRIAPAIRSALVNFAKPWLKVRALRIFMDQADLSANPALWDTIEHAMDDCEYLILLASPKSASSVWIEKELRYWLESQSLANILIVQTDGDIKWDTKAGDFDWYMTNALPRILQGAFNDEPRWIDLRWARYDKTNLSLANPKFMEDIASLAAVLHGQPKDDLIGTEVRVHHRKRQLITGISIFVVALLTYSIIMTIVLARYGPFLMRWIG